MGPAQSLDCVVRIVRTPWKHGAPLWACTWPLFIHPSPNKSEINLVPIEMAVHVIPFLDLTAQLITAGACRAGVFIFSFIVPGYTSMNLQHVMYLSMVRLMSLFSDCPGAPGVVAHIDGEWLACSLQGNLAERRALTTCTQSTVRQSVRFKTRISTNCASSSCFLIFPWSCQINLICATSKCFTEQVFRKIFARRSGVQGSLRALSKSKHSYLFASRCLRSVPFWVFFFFSVARPYVQLSSQARLKQTKPGT